MNAVTLYITTCRYVIQSNPQDPDTWVELYRYLPYLRQALSCCVCTQVFHCPMGPEVSKCQHHVCKECVGGKMRLKPSCGWCNNFDDFIEKPQLRIVVQCFKKLCEYIASSAIPLSLASLCTNSVGTVSGNQLLSIIQEAVAIKDDIAHIPSSSTSNLLPPPTLRKVDDATDPGISKLSFVSNYVRRTRKFKRKRRSGFGRAKIVKKHNLETITTNDVEQSSREEPEKTENSIEKSSCVSSQENDTKIHSLLEQSPHKKSFITETMKAEHDYIKELPVETDDKTVTKSRSRKYSGHSSSTGEVLNRKNKTESIEKVNNNNSPEPTQNHTSVASCEDMKTSKNHGKSSSRSQSYGCRCGLATPTPGNLTCCGQRCPCYSAFKGCESCKCRGCRNPRGDPATNPLAAMRLQRQFHSVHVIQTPINHLGGFDMSPSLLPVTSGLGDDELNIDIDI